MNGINPIYIQGYASSITTIINAILVPVLISIAFIVFLWGIYNYFILGADNETKRSEGKTFSLYGIVGFVVIFSVWGIVQIFMGTLGLSATNAPSYPTIGGGTNSGNPTNPFSNITNPTGGNTTISAQTCAANGGVIDSNGNCVQNSADSAAQAQLMQANQVYNTCMAQNQNNSSACRTQLTSLGQVEDAYKSSGGGTLPNGATCSSVTACASGYCTNKVCTNSFGDASAGLPNGMGCTTNGACASRYCDLSVDSCAASGGTIPNGSACTTNTGCASGYCTNKVCTNSFGDATAGLPNDAWCTSDDVCASKHCDPYEFCTNAQSTGGTGTGSGNCAKQGDACSLNGVPGKCVNEYEISSLYCDTSGTSNLQEGTGCSSTSQCGEDLRCDPTTNKCAFVSIGTLVEGQHCVQTKECSGNLWCNGSNVCASTNTGSNLNGECSSQSQCPGGICTTDNVCKSGGGGPCSTADDCTGSLLCPNGVCVPPSGLNEPCVTGSTGEDDCQPGLVCQSGYCIDENATVEPQIEYTL